MGGRTSIRLYAALLLLGGAGAAGLLACSLDELGTCVGACLDGGTDSTLPPHRDGSVSDAEDGRSHVDAGPCTTTGCDVGLACNQVTGVCSKSCAGGLVCNGGCCDGEVCVSGSDSTACGNMGLACAPCGGDAPTCVNGVCSAACDGGACAPGSCCGGAVGACMPGGSAKACGSSVACVDCTTSARGHACVDAGCGCSTASDCPPHTACNGGACTTACSSSSPCHGGCCSAAGSCVSGTTDPANCGTSGGECNTCVGKATGAACLGDGGCGCEVATDCPVGSACQKSQCGDDCADGGLCNGGCCDGTHCQPGSAPTACGADGGACAACAGNTPVCGASGCAPCTAPTDCPALQACQGNGSCSASCQGVTCNGGCCLGMMNPMCSAGTSDTACGNTGGHCTDCQFTCAAGERCQAVSGGGACGCSGSTDCSGGACMGRRTCNTSAEGGVGACTN